MHTRCQRFPEAAGLPQTKSETRARQPSVGAGPRALELTPHSVRLVGLSLSGERLLQPTQRPSVFGASFQVGAEHALGGHCAFERRYLAVDLAACRRELARQNSASDGHAIQIQHGARYRFRVLAARRRGASRRLQQRVCQVELRASRPSEC